MSPIIADRTAVPVAAPSAGSSRKCSASPAKIGADIEQHAASGGRVVMPLAQRVEQRRRA